jgi:hypothetical protein
VPEQLKFTIPVRPHLKSYLQDFYQLPYELNQKDDIGLFLYHLLRRRLFRDRKYYSLEGCSDTVEILISRRYALREGVMLLNDYQVHLFNRYLEDMMVRHSITWIRAAELAGMTNKEAIYRWMETYNLDYGSNDWYHRIKKQYFRYRKAKISPNTAPPAVP